MKFFLSISFSIVFLTNIFCQGKKNLPNEEAKITFEADFFTGKILKHNSKFTTNISEFSYGFELSASYKTFGNKNWQRALNYPEIGISYVQNHFGDNEVFGNAYGLVPFAKFNITRSKIVDFYAKLGGGLSYISKTYDPVDNPTNIVIGSKINTIVQFKMGLDFAIHKEVDLSISGALTHYSNASTQAPNLGINIPTVNIGIAYKPKKYTKTYITEQNSEEFKKKNEYSFRLSLGLKDRVARGAKFPVYTGAIQYARYIGYANKILAGASFSFDQYEYDFLLIQENFEGKNQFLMASDFSLYGGYEMLVGKVGLQFVLGAYVYGSVMEDSPIWTKPGITYYFTEFGKQKHKPYIGVDLKTHYFVAQYAEINFGIAF